MRAKAQTRTKKYFLYGLIASGVIAWGGFLFGWSGIYSIAASNGHFKVVEWVLTFGMRSSVRTHAMSVEVPALDNVNLSTLGAAHFHSGCAFCHGAPGVDRSPITLTMLPPPPNLATEMRAWRDHEMFWIVKHGIKYTGMPGWVSQQRDDEVWAVIAFLKKLPGMSAEAYRDIAVGELWIPPQSGRQIATTETTAEAATACARCHGADKRGTNSDLVPLLHGQPIEFLAAALEDYAHNKRGSGIMQPVASDLPPEARKQVAAYYAGLAPLAPSRSTADAGSIERGRLLAEQGDAKAKIPSCAGCHSDTSLKTFPRLAGQNAAYIANRLRLWRSGYTATSETDMIMAPIGKALSDAQIDDVAAYYASLNGPGR